MYNNATCAAKGEAYGNRNRHLLVRSMQRAAVNIYKTENSYELMVFAPGRIKEHFAIDVNGTELRVSYTPPQGFPRPDWVQREYSRGGFVRTFDMGSDVDSAGITAQYTDGVLQIHLPVVAGKETTTQKVSVQ